MLQFLNTFTMWDPEIESYGEDRDCYNDSFDSNELDDFEKDGFMLTDGSWYAASVIPSDLLIRVGGVNFHLHKYPLLSRSGKVSRIISDSPGGSELKMIEFHDIPGGPDSFMVAARFCYGFAVDLTPSNIAGLRCASEYLGMTEDLEEGNLILKTEAFLSYVVLSSWNNSIVVLRSCERLSPWAENLQIVRRCSESIAWKACARPKEMKSMVSSLTWDSGSEEGSPSSWNQQTPSYWWFEDVSTLRIDHFVRVVSAIKLKGMRFQLIGAAIMNYASKCLPNAQKCSSNDFPSRDQQNIIESLIGLILPFKNSVPCSFLLQLLKMANMLQMESATIMDLEKRIGMQLEQASLPDLLIPSNYRSETSYDVDLVQRLVEHFLDQERTEVSSTVWESCSEKDGCRVSPSPSQINSEMKVAKLLDGYLAEVSMDRHLPLTKFKVLAKTLPGSMRNCDDRLYRAVDSYLKAHPLLSNHERMRLCQVMDCQKLSADACMHAVKNERLPIRFIVQILLSKQVTMTDTISKSCYRAAEENNHHQPMLPVKKQLLQGPLQRFQEKEISKLKFELENLKSKHSALQENMDSLHRMLEEMPSPPSKPTKHSSSVWSHVGRKLSKMKMSRMDEYGAEKP